MANLMLREGERVRQAWCVIFLEDVIKNAKTKEDKENPYGLVLKHLAGLKSVTCACSPLHDQDTYDEQDVQNWVARHINPDTGDVAEEYLELQPKVGDNKKVHVHILIVDKGPHHREWFNNLLLDIVPDLKPNRWQKVVKLDAAIRYLAHLDHKEFGKHEYSALDVHGFGGMDLSALLRQDKYAKVDTLFFVQRWIFDNEIRHYHKLVHWAWSLGDYEIINCVTGRASYFSAYFRSVSDERAEERALMKEQKRLMEVRRELDQIQSTEERKEVITEAYTAAPCY